MELLKQHHFKFFLAGITLGVTMLILGPTLSGLLTGGLGIISTVLALIGIEST